MARTRDGYVKIQLSWPEGIVKSLKVAAAQRGVSLSDYALERIAGQAGNPVHITGDFVIAPPAVIKDDDDEVRRP